MNYNEMSVDELRTRQNEIAAEIDALTTVEEVNERSAEFDAIKNELEARAAAEAKKAEIRNAVANGAGVVIETIEERKENKMEVEIRNSTEYINAFANAIKNNDEKFTECRALLSTNGTDATSPALTGYVPVPEMVENIIKTAWEENNLLTHVKKTFVRGNLKVAFELSASGASNHAEGRDAPNEEVVTLGLVALIAVSRKKWITVSDEAMDMSGAALLNYIMPEIAYRIAQLVEEELVDIIVGLPDTATTTSVSAATITSAPSVTLVAEALGSVVGRNNIIVMNRGSLAAFKAVQYAANYPIDIFEGRNVVFSNALPSYAEAVADDDGDVYAIVGDFFEGAQANFPNGEEITIKVDDLSLAEKDLVKFVGREYVGLGAVADKRFCLIAAPTTP